ncbi:MAG TPA: UvrD-helicase domain-containing protein [Burkholderiales bacterium]
MIPDQSARDAALDPKRSFIVQAPAGSGKTTLLVDRFLALIKLVEKPEEVVAITFTKKAAAEMRKRVLEQVPPELAPRLRIQTIDALCAALTQQMPVLAKFGAQPGVDEDADDLYEEAATRLLSTLNPSVEKLLSHLDNNVGDAVRLLAEMLKRRDQWLRNTGRAPTRAELEAALLFERNRLLAKAKALYPQSTADLAKEVLTKDGNWRKRPAAPQELVAIPGLEEALAALLTMPPAKYSETQWQALEAILALLNPALAQLLVIFSKKNKVDFTEIAHGALRALGTPEAPTDLLLSMDARVRHLLVDEFQDTSNSQWELLRLLTAGWQAGDGRTVFVVGDPMQSIYRFRDAQVGLFLKARAEGLPNLKLHPLTLTTNFRSQAKIVDWVNEVFPRVLPGAEDEASGAVPYSPSTPSHPPEASGEPTLETFADDAAEAQRVVALIQKSSGRTAILVRNRKHLDAIVPALKAGGIRFRAVEIDQLGEKQVVQDLYALTRALTHLADRVAWLAILRAPWVGLSLQDFSSFFENKTNQTIWELIQEQPQLSRFVSILKPALDNRLRGTLRDRVERAWLALGGPACVEDKTDLEDAEIFLDELERLEEAGDLADFGALAEALGKLYALPDVEAKEGEAVEIMTIHKAKGLEFDTVIVPGLDRSPRSGARPLFAWRSLAGGRLLLAPIDETGGDQEPLYRYVRMLDREAEDIEAGRLFYVAATRAKARLHLLGRVKVDEDGVMKRPSRRSLLGLAWDALGEHLALPTNINQETIEPQSLPAGELKRLAADFAMPAAPAATAWTAEDEGRTEEGPPFDWAQETARHTGIVVHAWLQRIAEDALKGWDARRVESLRNHFASDLQARGVAPSEVKRAASLVVTALKNAITDERGRWLLGPHPVARNEYRLRNRLRSIRIDRYIEDAHGKKWVADYKTSEHTGGGPDAFLDEQRTRYAGQLDAYAEAVGGAMRGLYFPLQSGWRTW